MEVTEVQKITQNVIAEASKVVIAGEAVVEKLLVALLAGGPCAVGGSPGKWKDDACQDICTTAGCGAETCAVYAGSDAERYYGIECVQSEGWGVSSGKGTGIYKCSACR